MSFFPSFPAGEFGPLFRLLDDYAGHVGNRSTIAPAFYQSSIRSFQPRFDVKEVKDGYELHGELPGVDQKDISIEFSDANTLSIKGRSERYQDKSACQLMEGQAEQSSIMKGDSNGYHKASVEEESGTSGVTPAADMTADATTEGAETQITRQPNTDEQPKTDGSRYWISERSTGTFARSFGFPDRVDQDNVKASLKNGILSVVVPKASAPATRRISID